MPYHQDPKQPQVQWDAAQYLRFGGERLRPALDLMLHLPVEAPKSILDLGCGAGNLTSLLQQRWPEAEVLGVDGSEDMLAKARTSVPQGRFIAADLTRWAPEHRLDLIYTNATLQWLPDHMQLFPRLLSFLNPGGCLAVQMPVMHDAPLRLAQVELAHSPAYADVLAEVSDRRNVLDMGSYYDLLRPQVATLDIWQTTYLHILKGADPVLEWASGSSLRPYLEKMEGDQLQTFRADYGRRMQLAYPPRANGSTLLPFQRMFIMATLPG
ncbi:methyltransferase domain-containing protein [Janthinobacterium sp. GW460P]|uniref:methyltransferase domain-containing protein n=1 Tax=unclassified Janthinobacterium TaxID=2610881 RepID=UPI000A320A61|nr:MULTISPECIES: methyltransferase domain-containing protein [unclassified Janthinobacterium]MCC7702655.1 methyltransferase domain-containing protein [Janthinobacterium sp. GW460P]MCC7708163.1 methyltransferase domain-containing protein [Janthinobacterium sp. GW460W]